MKANWVVVLMPPFLVCMTLLFGTQFVFLQLGFFRDRGMVLVKFMRCPDLQDGLAGRIGFLETIWGGS